MQHPQRGAWSAPSEVEPGTAVPPLLLAIALTAVNPRHLSYRGAQRARVRLALVLTPGREQRESMYASCVDVCAAVRAAGSPTVPSELAKDWQPGLRSKRLDCLAAYGATPMLDWLGEDDPVKLLGRPGRAVIKIGDHVVSRPDRDVVNWPVAQDPYRQPRGAVPIFRWQPLGHRARNGHESLERLIGDC